MTVDKIIIDHLPQSLYSKYDNDVAPYSVSRVTPHFTLSHLPEVGVELALGQGHLVPGVEGRHAEVRTAAASAMRL